jgi:hypothetical protein
MKLVDGVTKRGITTAMMPGITPSDHEQATSHDAYSVADRFAVT